MTANNLEQLKAKLLQQRQEIFGRLHSLENGWQTLSEPDIEVAEEAQKAELTELFNRLDLQKQQQLEELDLALTRMAAATYGVCETCRKAIPLDRLQLLPATRYCRKCSARYSAATEPATSGE
jgi:RNA polymerase-binding transcription factor DksA